MSFLDKLFHRQPPVSAAQLGRNDLCWCGSGKKYKKCHFESDRAYFARTKPLNCKGSS